MKLKYILNETAKKNYKQQLTYNNLIKVLKENCYDNCKVMTEKHGYLYRNVDQGHNYFVINSLARGKRKLNYDSYVSVLLDGFTEWKEYPSRNLSLNVGTSRIVSAPYGAKRYYVIPYDNVNKYGICPEDDFWISFRSNTRQTVDFINSFINTILNIIYSIEHKTDVAKTFDVVATKYNANKFNYNDLVKILSSFHLYKNNEMFMDILNSMSYGDNARIFINEVLLSKDNVAKLEQKLSPNLNKFTLVNSFKDTMLTDREIWFEGRAVMIRCSRIDGIDSSNSDIGKFLSHYVINK